MWFTVSRPSILDIIERILEGKIKKGKHTSAEGAEVVVGRGWFTVFYNGRNKTYNF